MNRAAAVSRWAQCLRPLGPLCMLGAGLFGGAGPAWAQGAGSAPGAVVAPVPIVRIEAQTLSGSVSATAVAEGAVELRRGPLLLRADRLTYRRADETAQAEGRVTLSQDGNVFRGPSLTVSMPKLEGFFLQPEFDLARTGAGGRADRIDFQGSRRFQAVKPVYTGCPRDGTGDPDWLITARHLSVDIEANETVAEGAVLRFLGVPVLALPWMSFPATRERKSGWLTPTLRIDSRSGLEIGVPWYWNIAPDRDATITPRRISKRGVGLEGEFRYLAPDHAGQIDVDLTPEDALAGRRRHALHLQHGLRWPVADDAGAARVDLQVIRASDNDWWKDFRREILGFTPRLLTAKADWQRTLPWPDIQAMTYGRVQRWQTLQSVDDPFDPPYQRAFQWGLRAGGPVGRGVEWSTELEFNRFSLPETTAIARPTGQRIHWLGDAAWPWRGPVGWLVPRVSVNAALYDLDRPLTDGQRRLGRTIPTFSVDAGWTLERDADMFGRSIRQTLEPRLVYAYTPWRDQPAELAFDSAGRDFNFASIFATGDFSGVDRVSDANHLNAGAVTRFLDAERGDELLRLAVVQRVLFSDQRITPEGVPFTGRFSDLFLLGSTRAFAPWSLDGSLRWNAELGQSVRTVWSARYTPDGSRSLGLTRRVTQGQSSQWELGWQWPLGTGKVAGTPADSGCRRRWSTLGALNYSDRDAQLVSAKLGFKVDGGCWSGLVSAERVTAGPSAALTRLSFQLQLVGLGGVGYGL